MTLTSNDGPEGQMHHFNGPDVRYREPAKNKPTTECTVSLIVTPPAFRRRATGKHSPGLVFQAEPERAVKPLTDVFAALQIIDDELQRACRPLAELENFMSVTL